MEIPVTDRARGQRSQSMVEFALVAPLLLVLIFGIVDFGRVIYVYITINQAVNEGARAAISDSPLLPTNTDVENAVKRHAVDVSLANPCPKRSHHIGDTASKPGLGLHHGARSPRHTSDSFPDP